MRNGSRSSRGADRGRTFVSGSGFPRRRRLRKPSEFRRVFDGPFRAGDHVLLVFGMPNDRDMTRLGLSVSRKHGSAVRRVRKKRLLREAFRLVCSELPSGWDLVVVPRLGPPASVEEYQCSLKRLVERLQRKVRRAVNAPDAEPTS